jgi:hypothetical protein
MSTKSEVRAFLISRRANVTPEARLNQGCSSVQIRRG